jgi:hypothetical protein
VLLQDMWTHPKHEIAGAHEGYQAGERMTAEFAFTLLLASVFFVLLGLVFWQMYIAVVSS